MRAFFALIVGIGVLAGCAAGPDAALPVADSTASEPYRLDSGDKLRIVVYGDDRLSGDYLVDGQGLISMPLIAQVDARGLTSSELETAIAERLADGLLVNPSVNVQVQGMRPFYILGEVKQPGEYVCADAMTVLAAVAMAGGYTYRAHADEVLISRRLGEKVVDVRGTKNSIVHPGDVIYIYERYF